MVGQAHLALDGMLVSYTIKRSARRRAISILIDHDGLRVGAPWHATQNAIERLLHKHSDWVLRKLKEWHGRAAPRQWADGEVLMLLGEPITLRLVAAGECRVAGVRGAELLLPMSGATPRAIEQAVREWLCEQALHRFCERVEHFRLLARVPVSPEVRLSSARTRWGSCHSGGRIRLNWRLVQMPPRVIDYVVAHEVAHLIEMNHSKRFWRVVAGMVPDYASLRRELRRDGQRYLLV
jgi:predicted metal-dependent hydrolase